MMVKASNKEGKESKVTRNGQKLDFRVELASDLSPIQINWIEKCFCVDWSNKQIIMLIL